MGRRRWQRSSKGGRLFAVLAPVLACVAAGPIVPWESPASATELSAQRGPVHRPSVWQSAATGDHGRVWQLHVAVRELMGAEVIAEELKQSSLERARILLEAVRADKGGPPLLRFDLGTVYELLDRHERAAEVLEAALREAPDHPAATDAYRYLAYACAKLGRSEAERDAYRAFLGRETDDRSRAVALLNLAEAHMHLGELDEAIAGYRDAMRVAAAIPYLPSVDETGVLAAWGLAVAQHRAGDVASSLDSARIALQRDGKEALLRNRDRVFFVPDYEEEWYFAVAAMARARSSVDAALAEKHWAAAAAAFGRYASRATQGRRRADPATEDRWLGAARAHERTCEQERARAARAMRRTKAARSPEPGP